MAQQQPSSRPGTGTFTLLLFASAASYAGGQESLALAAPTSLGDVFRTLEATFPGFMAKVLSSSAVTLNLEYVDVEFPADGESFDVWGARGSDRNADKPALQGWETLVAVGDEVGVIPPVSSG